MNDNQVFEARVVQYEFEVELNAPPTRVWKALTDQLSSWWLPDFHMLGNFTGGKAPGIEALAKIPVTASGCLPVKITGCRQPSFVAWMNSRKSEAARSLALILPLMYFRRGRLS